MKPHPSTSPTRGLKLESPSTRAATLHWLAALLLGAFLPGAAFAQSAEATVYGDILSLPGDHKTVISDSTWLTLQDNSPFAWYSVHSYGGLTPEVGAELHAAVPGADLKYYGDAATILTANQWWFRIGPKAGFGASQTSGTPVPISFEYSISFWGATADDAGWWATADLAGTFFGSKYATGLGGTKWTGPIRNPPNLGTDLGHHLESYTAGYNQWQRLWIKLEAGVSAGGYDELGDSASFKGFIDPAVFVDPAWLAAHPDDEIVFATVTTPIPEPPAILGGLLACALALGSRWHCLKLKQG